MYLLEMFKIFLWELGIKPNENHNFLVDLVILGPSKIMSQQKLGTYLEIKVFKNQKFQRS